MKKTKPCWPVHSILFSHVLSCFLISTPELIWVACLVPALLNHTVACARRYSDNVRHYSRRSNINTLCEPSCMTHWLIEWLGTVRKIVNSARNIWEMHFAFVHPFSRSKSPNLKKAPRWKVNPKQNTRYFGCSCCWECRDRKSKVALGVESASDWQYELPGL